VYREDLLNGVLKIKVVANSYIHITESPVFHQKPSKDDLAKLRELIKDIGVDKVDKYFSNLLQHPAVTGFRGIWFKQFRAGDKPAIPGSSLKGAVRSRLELLFRARDGKVPSCFTYSGRLTGKPRAGVSGWRHVETWEHVVYEDRGLQCSALDWEYYEDINVCEVCDLFGTSGLASRVDFSSLTPETPESVNTLEELHVFFSCDRNKSIEGYVEAIKPRVVFEGEIAFKGLSPGELGLVSIAMNLVSGRELLLGRFKYRRLGVLRGNRVEPIVFGRIRVEPVEMRISIFFKNALDNILREHGFGTIYREEGFTLILKDIDLKNLLAKLEQTTYNNFKDYLPDKDFSEISILEKIWGREPEWWRNCRPGGGGWKYG